MKDCVLNITVLSYLDITCSTLIFYVFFAQVCDVKLQFLLINS